MPVHLLLQMFGGRRFMLYVIYSEATIILTFLKVVSFTPYWPGGQHSSHSISLSLVREVMYPSLMPVIWSLSPTVRLHSDRLNLIKECLCQSPTCYKQSAKLLGLAELLRVAGTFLMLNGRVRFLCYCHHYPGRTSEDGHITEMSRGPLRRISWVSS